MPLKSIVVDERFVEKSKVMPRVLSASRWGGVQQCPGALKDAICLLGNNSLRRRIPPLPSISPVKGLMRAVSLSREILQACW